jgi:hypothetical protein
VCSPCCETASSVASTASATSAPATTSHKKLSTGAAVGVGVGTVALLAIAAGIAFWWIWHVRKRKSVRTAETTNDPGPTHTDTSSSLPREQKYLIGGKAPGELPSPSKPTELHADSVELVELEGDQGQSRDRKVDCKPSTTVPEASIPRTRYRFEKYAVSPETRTPGPRPPGLSPVSDASSARPRTRQSEREDGVQITGRVAAGERGSPYTEFRLPGATDDNFLPGTAR